MNIARWASWGAFGLLVLLALIVMAGNAFAQNSSGSNSESGAAVIYSPTSNYKNSSNTPGVALGAAANPRTCSVPLGVGFGVAGFGGAINIPVTDRGCRIRDAFSMVGSIPGMRKSQRKVALTQVACQDKFAGRALTASGETCLVGKYKNRQAANVASVNYNRAKAGLRPVKAKSKGRKVAAKGVNANCGPRQLVYYDSNNIERSCR